MPEEDTAVDWDKLWDEYNQAVKAWMSEFGIFQKATTYFQTMCNDLMVKSSKESNIYPMNQFIENWQNVFNKPTMEQLKRYGDMMKKFSEDYTWHEMWNKNMMTNTKKGKTSTARKPKKSRISLAQKSKKNRTSTARKFKKTSR